MATEQELKQYLKLIKESYNTKECPVKYTLDIIGGKWKLRILVQLIKMEVVRFNELKHAISGITNTMLSNSLHELEDDGLITRKQYNEMPLRVEYSLTDRGKSLLPLLYELSTWGSNQIEK
ncbi:MULTISPECIES: winged helix-turn-helix transcriptional regulator [Clostridium]|uniref:HTH-type transcriptional regulator YybR n=4 Tax=Clostridium TaxID=1485 RepID=D8GI02_CLOLD|nr:MULTISPECIES: helix-turn-helix domain-containing protein [Clostridium]ADK14864.1 predicted transcriptional regulator [Clostridium ljungdahlii DSM 13528]AGY78111.1 helix-turn-helix transcriptional regulator [Clostridium autoethanogenum DSM 10061]ALU38244.1 Transcriptional regulator HxlR family [Clostridium autoethanogenum DSM 10061]OAA86299.1 putative HTH-type transcriptional regulator YybR [Clostridium coskatii]OAA87860.1 putative HTH-type transcriptional regulator YybR [Clostridium ljungda